MDREEMDKILAEEDGLVPSSGFAASVMERVEAEAATPAPIPFPWKRAIPGIVVAVAVLVWAAIEMARAVRIAGGLALPRMHVSLANSPAVQQAGWFALASFLAWAGWRLARRLSA